MSGIKPPKRFFEYKSDSKQKERLNIDSEIKSLLEIYSSLDEKTYKNFNFFHQFPLSKSTLKGLEYVGFTKPTEIQCLSIVPALKGYDIVAEAVTGSGKTVAFILPLLEYLYTNKISSFDGNIALILTPTRELASQIFNVLKKLAKFHKFTMIDVIGGRQSTTMKSEWELISQANVVVATPGRMAQHNLENSSLDLTNLKILILDEADRLLDPTFKTDLDSILMNIPAERQTLLFSATQKKYIASLLFVKFTRALEQLARLGLKDPKIVSTLKETDLVTPESLINHYAILDLDKKLDFLWTFLQNNNRKKILVFFSTQKQVNFVSNLFKIFKPLYTVHQLRGNMRQDKRFTIFEKFINSRQGSVLFTTNVAERGLDFPEVNWVIQADCPKTIEDFVHRVGRTARCGRNGHSLLLLLPSEEEVITVLESASIKITPYNIDGLKIDSIITRKSPQMLAADPKLSNCARLAFSAYLKDYCFRPKENNNSLKKMEKSTKACLKFNPKHIDVDIFAASLGLPNVPDLPERFAQATGLPIKKEEYMKHKFIIPLAKSKECKRIVFDIPSNAEETLEDDFMVKKSTLEIITDSNLEPIDSFRKKRYPKKFKISSEVKHLKFNEETEEPVLVNRLEKPEEGPLDLENERLNIKESNLTDKVQWRALIRERHRKERLKRKQERKTQEEAKSGKKLEDISSSLQSDSDQSVINDSSESIDDEDDLGSDVVFDQEISESEAEEIEETKSKIRKT